MNKLYILPLLFLLSLGAVYAVADGCTNAWTWHDDALGDQNVSAGNVCIDLTNYDVDPTAGVNCDEWYDYVDGSCSIDTYYVGYAGDGSTDCVATGWVTTGVPAFVAQGYIVNDTIASEPNPAYETNTGEVVPAKDACINGYTLSGPTGYCEGDGTLDTNGALANVSDGNVCIAGVDSDPDVTNKCADWLDCTAGSCTADVVYVGYLGDGTATCSNTGYVDY